MTLRAVLLALLSKEPNTGYGLGRLLRGDLHYLWDARLQQIYVELAKLRQGGFLDVETFGMPNRPPKKVYSLTAVGRQALDGWLADVPTPAAPRDRLLMRLYCMDSLRGDLMARALERYRDERHNDAAALEERRAQIPRTEPSQLGPLLTIEAALARAKCDVAWCVRAIATIAAGTLPALDEPDSPALAAGEG